MGPAACWWWARPTGMWRGATPAVRSFFQAEDGIRDTSVTGVQTCALPIWPQGRPDGCRRLRSQRAADDGDQPDADGLRRPHTAAGAVRRQADVDGLFEPGR